METFHKLFGSLLGFVYHCFDRIVIQGYLPLLTRPETIVHFFRDVHGVYPLTKDVLAKRTQAYQQWVEAFARNHRIPIEWPDAEPLKTKKIRKEDYVRPYGQRMARQKRFGVYFIFKSLEQGPKFGIRLPRWTLVLGPKFSKKDRAAINLRRAYSLNQVEYCRNFVFRRHFPIHKLFERSCELGVFRLTADVVTQIFGVRKHKRLRGKLQTMLEKLDHGHHVLRIYSKSLVARTYEKFGTFLRVEVCINRLKDLGLNKGLEQLAALREKLIEVIDRLAGVAADLLTGTVDFPLFEPRAKPIAAGRTKLPGIKIHDTRMLRLMEVLLHGGSQLAGWRTAQLYSAVLEAFEITPTAYSLTHLRYDVRKLRAHGLL